MSMLAQSSAESGEWYTPRTSIKMSTEVLGVIDYDPCSCEVANRAVGASSYGTDWEASWGGPRVFVNPPGSCRPSASHKYGACGNSGRCSCKLPERIMSKSIAEAAQGSSVIYLAYSINQMHYMARAEIPSGVIVTLATPRHRLAYVSAETGVAERSAPCNSAFFMIGRDPDLHKRFSRIFGERSAIYTKHTG